VIGRNTQGVRLIDVQAETGEAEDRVVSIAKLVDKDDDEKIGGTDEEPPTAG
jgi:hypothetical protein